MKKLLLALLLLLPLQAMAIEVDKEKHLAAGVVLGIFGWEVGCGAGAAKEAHDQKITGSASFEDFAYTCGGAILTDVIGRDKSVFYRSMVASIILDGISTSGAFRDPNAYETNPRWVYLYGRRPDDGEILMMTLINLGVVEIMENVVADDLVKNAAYSILTWKRYKVVKVNFEIARW